MPVYLCQSGLQQGQPWRFGIQVYAAPFPIEESATSSNVATSPANNETAPNPRASGGRDLVVATWMPGNSRTNNEGGSTEQNQQQSSASTRSSALLVGHAIRRVRHAEIVLVDDVCIAHDRYWLRLRWPGHKGGFAGYIAMGLVNEQQKISGKWIYEIFYINRRRSIWHSYDQNAFRIPNDLTPCFFSLSCCGS